MTAALTGTPPLGQAAMGPKGVPCGVADRSPSPLLVLHVDFVPLTMVADSLPTRRNIRPFRG